MPGYPDKIYPLPLPAQFLIAVPHQILLLIILGLPPWSDMEVTHPHATNSHTLYNHSTTQTHIPFILLGTPVYFILIQILLCPPARREEEV